MHNQKPFTKIQIIKQMEDILSIPLTTTAAPPTAPETAAAPPPATANGTRFLSIPPITIVHKVDGASIRNLLLLFVGIWIGGKLILMLLSFALEGKR